MFGHGLFMFKCFMHNYDENLAPNHTEHAAIYCLVGVDYRSAFLLTPQLISFCQID